ncbi:uncharacterized protein RB166_015756 [Leptodactylus fuscus]|uniref:uncharacterized protein LOC142217444 n=1 Tax=Leptodactylus fuscus TaxID=238119 RepID=UPI003F4E59CA
MADVMYQKLNQIKEIMEKTKEITKGKKSSPVTPGHNIAIISTLEEKDVQWLLTVISSQHFQEQVKNVNLINIKNIKESKWEKLLVEYTFCIYVSKEHQWTQGTSPSKAVKSLSSQGKKNLIVVIDDVNDGSDEKKMGIKKHYSDLKKYARDLFLFSRMEKESDYLKFFDNSPQPEPVPEPNQSRRGSQPVIAPKVVIGIRYRVGIFSRSADRDFAWLSTLLTSEPFKDHVLSVRPCFISNNGFQKMNEDLSHCSFGILYHTKNKGRVNITGVTDSLYDEELEHLSVTLGKKNLIVVIDDLEDASDQVKIRLLHTQSKIADFSDDLILISLQDKIDNMGQTAKLKILQYFLRLSDERLGNPTANSGYEKHRGSISNPSLDRSRSSSVTSAEIPAQPTGHAPPAPSRSTIGIFSRSDKDDYLWLERLLTSEEFGQKDVLGHKISGHDNEALREVAFKSKFGILYHSFKRGKIRLTDVNDSLYNEELLQLSTKLGKRKMIVVIDDLDDSGDKLKHKILEKQPSLGRLAAETFLFTTAEKKEVDHQSQGKHGSKMSKSTREKISRIKQILT